MAEGQDSNNAEKLRMICSECGLESSIVYETRKFGSGLEETYIICDICSNRITCFITNPKVRKLQKETQRLRKAPNKTELEFAEIERNQTNINATMERLQKKHGREA